MMKKERINNMVRDRVKTVHSISIYLFILWQLIILFAFWGGKPEGCFYKIRELRNQVNMLRELRNQVNMLQDQCAKSKLKNHRHKLFSGEVYYPKR